MIPEEFQTTQVGSCVKSLTGYWMYKPNPLPFEVEYTPELIKLLSDADRALGDLSGSGRQLQNPYLLINPFIRKEAVSSSKIEGTQASLDDLLIYEVEMPDKPKVPDVKETRNYVTAMERGLELLSNFPVSGRLMRAIHEILLSDVRGNHLTPGEFRRTQNWIGPAGCTLEEATYVPPQVEDMKEALSSWEHYMNTETDEPPLVKCALMHYQFEAIHPFLDGNGRIGRLLITFFLCERNCLSQPLLYLSEFFERHREEYYSALLNVSQKGDIGSWIMFFLRGIREQCKDAVNMSTKLLDLHKEYMQLIHNQSRKPEITYRLLDEIFMNPFVSITRIRNNWNVPYITVKRGISYLNELGIIEEFGERKRNKIYFSPELLSILYSADNKT